MAETTPAGRVITRWLAELQTEAARLEATRAAFHARGESAMGVLNQAIVKRRDMDLLRAVLAEIEAVMSVENAENDVPCPKCGAGIGSRCQRRERGDPHIERIAAYHYKHGEAERKAAAPE